MVAFFSHFDFSQKTKKSRKYPTQKNHQKLTSLNCIGHVIVIFFSVRLYCTFVSRIKINDFSTNSACQNHDFQSIQLLSYAIQYSFISKWFKNEKNSAFNNVSKITYTSQAKINVLLTFFLHSADLFGPLCSKFN